MDVLEEHMIRHAARNIIALGLAAGLTACSSVGGGEATEVPSPGVSYPQVNGAWMGALQIEGQGYNTIFDIAQSDGMLRVEVEIPMLELVTMGRGRVLPDGTLRLSFRYELECPGDAQFVGAVTEGDTVLEGTLLASDCTGDLRGTFRLSR
jgi:hypothetical protein